MVRTINKCVYWGRSAFSLFVHTCISASGFEVALKNHAVSVFSYSM